MSLGIPLVDTYIFNVATITRMAWQQDHPHLVAREQNRHIICEGLAYLRVNFSAATLGRLLTIA